MIVKSKTDVIGTKGEVCGDKSHSVRLLHEEDGMGVSLVDGVLEPGFDMILRHRNHLEACYCIEGKGTVEDLESGQIYRIEPGTLYAMNNHDHHRIRAATRMRLICTFVPPLSGDEVQLELQSDASESEPVAELLAVDEMSEEEIGRAIESGFTLIYGPDFKAAADVFAKDMPEMALIAQERIAELKLPDVWVPNCVMAFAHFLPGHEGGTSDDLLRPWSQKLLADLPFAETPFEQSLTGDEETNGLVYFASWRDTGAAGVLAVGREVEKRYDDLVDTYGKEPAEEKADPKQQRRPVNVDWEVQQLIKLGDAAVRQMHAGNNIGYQKIQEQIVGIGRRLMEQGGVQAMDAAYSKLESHAPGVVVREVTMAWGGHDGVDGWYM